MQPLPEIAPVRPAWGDKVIARFLFREALFLRRGWDAVTAETWAERLAERDEQRDDRRLCIECQNLQRGGYCAQAARLLPRRKDGRAPVLQPVTDILQRCEAFRFVTP